MPVLGVGALAIGLLAASFGQVSFKLWATRGSRTHLVLALGLFLVGQLGFFAALTQLEIGVVYMTTALSQILVLALARGLVSERLTRDHAIAVGLIAVGVVLYAS